MLTVPVNAARELDAKLAPLPSTNARLLPTFRTVELGQVLLLTTAVRPGRLSPLGTWRKGEGYGQDKGS